MKKVTWDQASSPRRDTGPGISTPRRDLEPATSFVGGKDINTHRFFSGVLWSDIPRRIVEEATDLKLDIFVWTGCGFGYFLLYFGSTYSSVLLVIILFEKFFALYFPLKTKTLCTVSMARKVSLVTAIIFIGFNLQYFFITKKLGDSVGEYCYYGNAPEKYLNILFSTVFPTLYSYLPFSIMACTNIAIIYKFVSVKWRNRQGNTDSTSQAVSKSATRGTAMLLTISLAFIILTSPIMVANAVWPNSTVPILIFKSLMAIQYLNHGINGILYCIVGSRFRNELKNLFICKKNTRFPLSSHITNTAVNRTTSMKESPPTVTPNENLNTN